MTGPAAPCPCRDQVDGVPAGVGEGEPAEQAPDRPCCGCCLGARPGCGHTTLVRAGVRVPLAGVTLFSTRRPRRRTSLGRGTAAGDGPAVAAGFCSMRPQPANRSDRRLNGARRSSREGWRPRATRTVETTFVPAVDPVTYEDLAYRANTEIVRLLSSIRAMLIFFTVLAILGLIGGVIGVVDLIHAANSSSTGF